MGSTTGWPKDIRALLDMSREGKQGGQEGACQDLLGDRQEDGSGEACGEGVMEEDMMETERRGASETARLRWGRGGLPAGAGRARAACDPRATLPACRALSCLATFGEKPASSSGRTARGEPGGPRGKIGEV